MSEGLELSTHPDRLEGKNIKARDFYDKQGQHFKQWMRETDVLAVPDELSGNTTDSELKNERNANRGQRISTHLVTDDPFEHTERDRLGAKELGANSTNKTSQTFANTTVPQPSANSLTLLSSTVEQIGRNSYKLTDVNATGYSEMLKQKVDKSPAGYGNTTELRELVVAPGTALPANSTVINAELKYIDGNKSMQSVLTAPDGFGTMTLLNQNDPQAFGAATTMNKTSVPTGTALANASILTLQLTQEDQGNGQSELANKTVSAWPTLYKDVFDETTKSIIRITKDIVAPGTSGSFSVGNVTEVHPYDALRSIQLRSAYVGTPSPGNATAAIATALPFTDSIQIPPRLMSATLRYVYAFGFSGASYDYAEDMNLEFVIKEFYSVAVKGRILRYFTATPPAAVAATLYTPQSFSIAYARGTWWITNNSARAAANIRYWQTPAVLCAGITITAPTWFTDSALEVGTGEYTTGSIPSTGSVPTGWTTVNTQVRDIKLGYYEVLERQLDLPDPFA